jgi:hypothetical protein
VLSAFARCLVTVAREVVVIAFEVVMIAAMPVFHDNPRGNRDNS